MNITPFKALKKLFSRNFFAETSGNVAMIAALSVIPIMSVVGVAVDFQLVVTKKNLVQQTLDATMIAVARERQAGATDAELELFVDEYFDALIKANAPSLTCEARSIFDEQGNSSEVFDVMLSFIQGDETLNSKIKCRQPTTLTAIFGQEFVDFEVTSGSTFGVGAVDVAFVFDISGSMNCPENLQVGFDQDACSGDNSNIRTRMDALKEAAQEAVDILLLTNNRPGSSIRIAMTGYTDAVNAGSFFDQVVDIPTGNDRRQNPLENSEVLGMTADDRIGKIQIDRSNRLQFFDYEAIECPNGFFRGDPSNCSGEYVDLAARFYYPQDEHPTCVWARQGSEAATDDAPTGNDTLRAARPVWDYSNNTNHNDDFNFFRKTQGQAEIQRQVGIWRHGRSNQNELVQQRTNPINGELFQTVGSINANAATCDQTLAPQPLTDDARDITRFIDDMEPIAGTGGHAGLAWGWYMLSPKWNNIWPNASRPLEYNAPETAKVLILMTDGEFNTVAPDVSTTSVNQAAALCTNIKSQTNITIFTVKFGAFASNETVQGQSITDFCASNNDLALNPTDGDALVEDFRQIAAQISDLRIAN